MADGRPPKAFLFFGTNRWCLLMKQTLKLIVCVGVSAFALVVVQASYREVVW